MHFWHISLSNYPEIKDFLKSCCKGETVKKAKVFGQDEIDQFLRLPWINNGFSKYNQVRAVVAVVALCGGNRMDEIKR